MDSLKPLRLISGQFWKLLPRCASKAMSALNLNLLMVSAGLVDRTVLTINISARSAGDICRA